jgi:hypothetical protein
MQHTKKQRSIEQLTWINNATASIFKTMRRWSQIERRCKESERDLCSNVKGGFGFEMLWNCVLQYNIQAHFIHLVCSIYVPTTDCHLDEMGSPSFSDPQTMVTGVSMPGSKRVEPGRHWLVPCDFQLLWEISSQKARQLKSHTKISLVTIRYVENGFGKYDEWDVE